MDQTMKMLIPIIVISWLAMLMQCANPVDEPPLYWRSKVQIPISNKDFFLKDELDNLFSWDSMKFLDPHPADKDSGNTMIFSIERFSTDTFETHEDSFDDQKFLVLIGPIPITGVPLIQKTGTLPARVGTFSVPVPVKLDSIYDVTFFDTITNKIPVAITNNSTTSTLRNVIFDAGTLGKDTIASISPGATDTAWLAVHGKKSNGTLSLTLSGIKSAGAATVRMSMNLNGLTASSIKANDHLIRFSHNVIHPYEITDTIDIDYIDIADGKFLYSIVNHTGIPLTLHGSHEHLWTTSYCIQTNKTKNEDLISISHSDSQAHYSGALNDIEINMSGDTIVSEIKIQPYTHKYLKPIIISYHRLFTIWDSSLQKSVTTVRYDVSSVEPKGDTVTLSSSDSIVFSIEAPSFKFKEFLGTSMEEYYRSGDTQKIFIDVPWNQSAQDSLRGRFILSKVIGDVFISPQMPDNAYIDTMEIQFVVFSPESISVQDSSTTKLIHVNKDSTFRRNIDLTDVTNLFPDTLCVTAKIRIPKGTRMKVENDLTAYDPDYARYIGRMKTMLKSKYFLNSDLEWTVRDTVRMDLGSGKFNVLDEFRYISKLDQKTASFHLSITNQSNLNMYLYALLAPRSRMNALDSIDGNHLTYLINNPDSALSLGFINFMGSDGVFIPSRNSTAVDTVTWNQAALDSITFSDSCSWRWQLRFVPNSRDALKDVDYLRIHSWLNIEGNNNTDSLMKW